MISLRQFTTRAVARQTVTKEQRALLRKNRKDAAQKKLAAAEGGAPSGTSSSAKQGGISASMISRQTQTNLFWYAGVLIPAGLVYWGVTDDSENNLPRKFARMIGFMDLIEDYSKPVHAKMLPDWGQMPNVPPGMPVPHTLVLDFEDTLVHATWDRRYGWRYAKRPGVDEFLQTMAQYYEIVIFSSSTFGISDPAVESLDKHHCAMHRLYRENTHYLNGHYIKDLAAMNRNMNRIITIDDDEDAYLDRDKGNLITIKKYSDANDRDDETLKRITPLLLEIARENYDNVPMILSQFDSRDANEMADEYQSKIDRFIYQREEEASRGLGSFAMNVKRNMPAPELPPQKDAYTVKPAGSLSAKDIVGATPGGSAVEEDGALGWFKRRQLEKAEQEQRKMEKWNDVMMKKQQAKQKEAAEARA